MNAGHHVPRKMVAAFLLAVCVWAAPSLLAETRTNLAAGHAQDPAARTEPRPFPFPADLAMATRGGVPISFEENRGQSDARVKFRSRGRGYTLFLTADEAVLVLGTAGTAALRMRLAGASGTARVSGEAPLPGTVYYAGGHRPGPLEPSATYQRVTYAEVYSGIDLVYYGREGRHEFDFVVAPHADPGRIRLVFSGADQIALTTDGELSLRVSGEDVRLKRPRVHQERDGRRADVAGGYVLTGPGGREVIFELADYDRSLPLVIDPQIDFATYLGGTGVDEITDVRVAPTGEVYVLGATEPLTGFPVTHTGPPPGLYGTDCFVSKLSADGSALLYSVILPGTSCVSMAVDLFGNVHLGLFEWGIGSFLRTLAVDGTGPVALTLLQGAFDFSPGSAEYMQVDAQGNVYLVIEYQPTGATDPEYHLFKVDAGGQLVGTLPLLAPVSIQQPSGTSFVVDRITGFAVDDAGHAFAIGNAGSAGRIAPTPNAFQPIQQNICGGGCSSGWTGDGFVLAVDTSTPGSFAVTYASYLGGSGADFVQALAVGHDGALYVTGQTSSTNFPTTPGAWYGYPSVPPGTYGFLVKLDLTQAGAQQLAIGTLLSPGYLGGDSIAVLPGGLPAVLGNQSVTVLYINPLYGNGFTNVESGPFVKVFSSDGRSLLFLSHLQPGAGMDGWFPRLVSNGSGKLYVAGSTTDTRLGSPGAYQGGLAGGYDGLVRSISGIATNSPPAVDLGPPVTVSQPLFTLACGVTLPCTISDADNDPLVSYRWVGPNGFTAASSGGPPVASVGLRGGDNRITLIVTDNQGAVGAGTLTVTVLDTDAPVVVPPPDLRTHSTEAGGARGSASAVLHDFLFVSATASDLLDPTPVRLPPQADLGAGPVDVDDQTLFPLGPTVVAFRFQDASGHVGVATATVTVTPNQPPVVSLAPDFTVTATSPAGANVTIYASASDPENDPLGFGWSGSTAGLVSSGAGEQLSGVLPIGVHPIGVTVTDGRGGSATASVTVTVAGINTTGPQPVPLLDDDWQQANFSSYWRGNPLGGHLVTLRFSGVQTPGLSYFSSRSNLVPPPPAGMQAGSPPYYYDIGTTAGYSGAVELCVNTRGMSFANPAAVQLHQLQSGSWTALPSSLTPGAEICAPVTSLGSFALFYPEVPETAISTIAGNGLVPSSIDGPGGDPRDDDAASGTATDIPLTWPYQGVVDRARNHLYFSDASLHVRRLDLTRGILTIIVGNGVSPGQVDGPGGDPQDDVLEGVDPLMTPAAPFELALDASGNLYYRDGGSCQVRKVDFAAGTVTTIAGNGTCGVSGDGGLALNASLSLGSPGGLAVDGAGNLFIAESANNRIRRIDAATGVITTVAGTGAWADPTPGVAATLSAMPVPRGMAFDAQGHLLVALPSFSVVRISPGADAWIDGSADETLSIAAGAPGSHGGVGAGFLPFSGDGGAAAQASVASDQVVVASDGALILNDSGLSAFWQRIRRVSPGADGIVTGAPDETIVTIAGYSYAFNGTGIYNGDTYATMATLGIQSSALEDAQGRIIVIDAGNNRIRRFGLSPLLGGGPGNPPSFADLSVSATAGPDPVDTGTSLTYSITATNIGPGDATGVVVDYPLASSETFVKAGSSAGSCTTPAVGSTGAVSCSLGTLAAGASASVVIVTTPTAAGTLRRDFTLSGNEPDPNRVNNTATVSVTVTQAPAVIAITEQIVVTDELTVMPSAMIGVAEAIRVTDAPVVVPEAITIIGVNETITLTDGPAVLPSATIGVAEAIRVTDAPAVVPEAITTIGVNEAITLTDAPAVLPSATIGVAEAIRVTDAPAVVPEAIATIGVNEAISLTDAPVLRDVTAPVVPMPGGGTMAISVPASQIITGVAIDPLPPATPPPGVSFPFGAISYTVTLAPGETSSPATMTFTPPLSPRINLYKTDHAGGILGVIPVCNGTTVVDDCWTRQDTATSTTIVLTLTDNGPFDLNPAAGIIEDPVIVGYVSNNPPTATAGANQILEATSPAGASVTLAGAGVDPDGDALTFAWSGPCGSASTASATFVCPLGTTTMTLTVSDGWGLSAVVTVTVTVRDTTPPGIVLDAPADGATYVLGRTVTASFSCADGGAGLTACSGSGANGAAVDTSSVGTKTFTVTATDAAGNRTSRTATYAVIYAGSGPCLWNEGHSILWPIAADGSSEFKQGLPVLARFRVCDANGLPVGTPGVVTSFKLVQVVSRGITRLVNQDVPSVVPPPVFRWDPLLKEWFFAIRTKDYAAGTTYSFRITLKDGTFIDFRFALRK